MSTIPGPQVDAWLRADGIVVAASDRAARSLRAAYHRARRSEGLSAWESPAILDWKSFARREWERRTGDGRMLLNTAQEQSLWLAVIAASGQTAGWLETPRRRLADLAIEAHGLLCSYAPGFLQAGARRAWQQDAGAFSHWLSSFEEECRQNHLLSSSQVPLELLQLLAGDASDRPALVLAGFDRLLPIQEQVFRAWGSFRFIEPNAPAAEVLAYAAPNQQLELTACVRWCMQQLDADGGARLLVVCPDASARRGEMERAFLQRAPDRPSQFEFSLGIPLARVGLARAALLLLHWLDGTIEEQELDWLLSSGYCAAGPEEIAALAAYMRALRRRGLQRTHWTLDAFLRQPAGSASPTVAWSQRLTAARQQLTIAAQQPQSPLDWAMLAAQLLQSAGWPGSRPLTSAEFQAANRCQQALDLCGSLGFDGRRINWHDFVAEFERIAAEMLFSEESQDAPILIAGPAESAGLTADGIWFLGADEDTWPARGSTHPLLPIEVQREAGMPHAFPALDWTLSQSITTRLLHSASQVCFSFARQKDDVETRASRLIVQHAGAPQPLPLSLAPDPSRVPLAVKFEDIPAIPLPSVPAKKSTAQLSLFDDTGTKRELIQYEVPGGATVLTSQSQCAFKAFATARLGAQQWEPAETGLTAAQRGQLLHGVLHAIWSETPQGIRNSTQLHNLGVELRPFVEGHVRRVLEEQMPVCAREQMPPRYLELEEQRLTRLVSEWLEYERQRVRFDVAATEVATNVAVAGLTLKLRLDRVDRLDDGSLLVIDYKTGNVSPKSWQLPRPDDVQLPLYAEFALPPQQELGGLVFAKVRPNESGFAGRMVNPQATLDPHLHRSSGLVKNPLTAAQLSAWRDTIEQLARDFIAGRADVDPSDYPATCERCGLYTLCRVREREDQHQPEEDESEVLDD